jgi:hypothetical protein
MNEHEDFLGELQDKITENCTATLRAVLDKLTTVDADYHNYDVLGRITVILGMLSELEIID